MALQKQVVPVSFGQGIDTKTDPQQVVFGKLLLLGNALFKGIKNFIKRNGFTSLTRNILGGGSIATGTMLGTFKNEILEFDGTSAYSYSPGNSTWTNKGTLPQITVDASSVFANYSNQYRPDSACDSSTGLQVFTFEDSSTGVTNQSTPTSASINAGGLYYSVIDYTSGEGLVTYQLVDASGFNSKVLKIGTNFVILYQDASDATKIRYKTISTSTPATLSARSDLATDFDGTCFDSTILNNRLFTFYSHQSNTKTYGYYLDTSLVRSSQYQSPAAFGSDGQITVFGDSVLNELYIPAISSINGTFKYIVVSQNLVDVLAPTTVEVLPTDINVNVTGVSVSSGTGQIFFEYVYRTNNQWGEGTNQFSFAKGRSTFDTEYVKKASLTRLGVVSNDVNLMLGVGIGSKAFVNGGVAYLHVIRDMPLQPTLFLINSSGVVVAKIAQNQAGPMPGHPAANLLGEEVPGTILTNVQSYRLPEVNLISTDVYNFAYTKKDLVTTVGGAVLQPTNNNLFGVNNNLTNIYFQTGIYQSNITFNYSKSINVELANNLHTSGGIVSMYDGNQAVEHNFHQFPEQMQATLLPYIGSLQNASFQFTGTYRWTDEQGQIHESSPAVPVTSVLPALTYLVSPTNGNDTLPFDDNYYGQTVFPGALLTGTHIPANTYVLNYDFTTNKIKMSANATGTATGITLTITPNLKFMVRSMTTTNPDTAGSSILRVAMPEYLPMYGTKFVAASKQMDVMDATYLKVGMTVKSNDAGLPAAGSLITAISGNTITLADAPASQTGNGFTFLTITYSFSAAVVSGNPTATSVAASVTADLTVGQRVWSGQFPPGSALIISKTATTVTFDTNFGGTLTTILDAGFDIRTNVQIGQKISATGIAGTATIIAVTGGTSESDTANIIQIDQVHLIGSTFVTADCATTNGAATRMPMLRQTQKSKVFLYNYRTLANGTQFYLTTNIKQAAPTNTNDTTTNYFGYFDDISDYIAVGNLPLYTNSGEVENIAAPPTNILFNYKSRLIGVNAENTFQWFYSKQALPGTPVGFSDLFTKNIDQRGGGITAGGALDDKIIFFKKSFIMYVAGDGPSPNGANDDFTEAQLVTTDTGCSNQRSVVTIPNGLMFQSANKGIYLLDRSLQVKYIGAEVESYNSQTVTSARLSQNSNLVYFTMSGGDTLVYDYYVGQWSIFYSMTAVDSVIYNNLLYHLKSNGVVNQETPGTFTDSGAVVPLSLTTAWLPVAGIQGFQRIYKMLILGNYKSSHILGIQIAYDYATTPSQTTSITVATDPGVYQYRVFTSQQKCEAIQVTLTETQPGALGEGLRLSALAFEVGIKKGVNKIIAAKSVG